MAKENNLKKVLVIAAHPDDEALGAAGTLARHAEQGDGVDILFLADGEGARGSTKQLTERQKAAEEAGNCMGARTVSFHDFPDNRMDKIDLLDVVKVVETEINKHKPNIIYTHHGGDLNVDHKITHRAVLTACRPMPDNKVEQIYGFEVMSSTEWASPNQDDFFRPQHHVDISDFFEKKRQALECYKTEMRDFPHSRSIQAVEALATLRGAQVGFCKAESFTILRSLVLKT